MNKIKCIIPARLNSSRFPQKVLKKIKNKTVLQHCIDNAKTANLIDEVFVATPDKKIFNQYKPSIITNDNTTCTGRVCEASYYVEADYIVNLQSDEPCITGDIIDQMIRKAKKNTVIQACYPVTKKEIYNPHIVKAIINNGEIIYLTRKIDNEILNSKNVLGICGAYIYDRNTIRNFYSYDLELVNSWKGLDTLAFIGKVKVLPFIMEERTPAVDIEQDIITVENYYDKRRNY